MRMVRYGVMLMVLLFGRMEAQMLIPNLSPVTESFSMGTSGTASLPTGFVVSNGTTYTGGTSATTLAYGSTGTGAVTSSSSGGTINWANGITASATDRALGFLNTGTFTSPRSIMLKIQNTTGGAIGSLTISFDYEKYRSGTRAFDWTFFSGSDGSTWTAQTAGDQSYAADAANTTISNPPLTTSKTNIVISGLNIANNGFYYLRWTFTGVGGSTNGQGIGLDNLSITASSANSSASDIIANASFTYPTNIAYASHTGADVTSSNPELFEFDVRDGGATTDADASSTTLTSITFAVTNSSVLNKVAVYDGTTELAEVTAGSSITFSGLTAAAADGATKTLNLRATYKSSVTDNTQVSFTVSAASADGAGSTFAAANAGAAASSTAGDNNRIEVTATDLLFNVNPSVVSIGAVMSPSPTIVAVDGNANTDLDFSGTVSLTTTGTFDGTATTSAAASSGTATFSNLIFSASGTGVTIAGTATGVNGTGNSMTFDVTDPQPEINVKQGVTSIATGGSYGFGSLTSGTSSSAVTFTIENIGTASLSLSGTPKVAVSGTNAAEFTVDQTSTAASVAASGTTTFTVTFSPTSSGSKSASLSIANNDVTGSENPYVINLSGTGTVSSASDIAATSGFTYPANIDYASSQTAATLTAGNSVGVMGVTVRDGGASADADNLSTTLTALSFTTGSSTAIRTAALFDGSTNISEVAVNGGTTIAFTGLSVAAADGGTKDLVLRVTFQSAVTDNQQIAFTVSSAAASAAGSGFAAANAGAAASSVTGDDNRLEVTATKFNFSTQPSAAAANTNFSAAVEALDANNNRDLDAVTSVTLSASAGTLSSVTGLTQNLVSGLYSWTDLQNNTAGSGVTLSASGALTTATSNAFNIVAAQPATQASTLLFSSIGMTSMTVSWTNGDGAARIVVAKAAGTPTTPTDGVTYTANAVFGSGGTIAANEYVVYNGTGSTVTVSGLTGSTSYTFKVFEYNGSGGTENYLTTSNAATQATTGLVYYSNGSGDPTVLANWKSNRDGSGTSPANFTAGETFTIENGDNMTTSAAWSISGTNSKLQIEAGGTLTATSAVTLASATAFVIDSAGTYVHANTTAFGTSIFQGTESFSPYSTVEFRDWNTTGPSVTAWGNVRFNGTGSISGSLQLSGNMTTINGNLEVVATGSPTVREVRFAAGTAPTVTVKGNYTQSGGTVNLASTSGSSVTTFNVGGNVAISSGSFTSTSTGSKLVFNGTSQQSVTTNGLSSVPNIDIPVAGNVIVQDSLIYSGTMTVSGKLSFGTGTKYIGGTGTFTVNSGATLSLASVNGISSSSTAGNIRNSGSRSLSTAANYELITSGATTTGAHTQITGTGFPATVNNFTVNNTLATDSIFLSGNLTVNGTMTMTSGNVRTSSNTLTLGTAATLSGETAGRTIIGTLTATKSVGAGASTLGGIGLSLAAGADDLGDVTVTRVTGTSGAVTVGANTGILRKFTVSSVNAPAAGRALTLTWLSDEDNGKALASGTVWKSVNSGSTWTLAASGDYSLRSVTLPSETAFGQYTISDVTSPLPVEIVHLTAVASGEGITITWKTASELNNHGFEIERATAGRTEASWTTLGFVEGKGTTSTPQEYSFSDATASGTVQYRLKQIDRDGHFTYSGIVEATAQRVVTSYGLDQNYPNPFNPGTRIAYQLLNAGTTTLKVYDMLGKQVALLVNGFQSAGEHTVDFNASALPSGLYFYTLRSGAFTSTRKMLLVK